MKNPFTTSVASEQSVSFSTQGFAAKAFTMAEILLSLTIIGVVAAITLPSLMGNINERTWNTQRKALHARMSQAIAMMPQLNGYGVVEGDDSLSNARATEAFITEGLSKVLKINNVCDSEHLTDCGLSSLINPYTGNVFYTTPPKTSSSYADASDFENRSTWMPSSYPNNAALETQNGESILVMYNYKCVSDPVPNAYASNYYFLNDIVCANMIYDLNGAKGPNTPGKDIGFLTALYATDSKVVAPLLASKGQYSADTWSAANSVCAAADPNSRVPNLEEGVSLMLNMHAMGSYGWDNRFNVSNFTELGKVYLISSGVPSINGIVQDKESFYNKFYCIKR